MSLLWPSCDRYMLGCSEDSFNENDTHWRNYLAHSNGINLVLNVFTRWQACLRVVVPSPSHPWIVLMIIEREEILCCSDISRVLKEHCLMVGYLASPVCPSGKSSVWMKYVSLVAWYWKGKTELLGEKHYRAWVVDEWMSMEQWWNDTDRGKLKYWEKNIIERGW
jgi:hypothetical protein